MPPRKLTPQQQRARSITRSLPTKRPDDPDRIDARRARAARREVSTIQKDAIARVRTAEHLFRRSQDQLDAAVRHARNTGCSWQMIANVFGVTRSAAEQRFHNVGANKPLRRP